MLKSPLITAALVICTVGGAASAYAQAPTSPTHVTDRTTSSTAQGAGGPSCTGALARAKDNIFLRIQQNTGAESRAAAQLHLSLADRAAASGDEAGCWKELDLSHQFVR